MNDGIFLEKVPIWIVFISSVVLVLVSLQGGIALAFWHRRKRGPKQDSAVGSAVGAMLGLLAFILAFTFSMAASRRDIRRELMLAEVNVIQTAYLRADLLSAQHQAEVRDLIKDYVQIRIDLPKNPENFEMAIAQSAQIQNQLWSHARALAHEDLKNADITSLFIDSLNDLINMQNERIIASRYHIPNIIWGVFVILTLVSMTAVGYHFGQSGRSNLTMNLALALSFSIVVFLIADLDRGAAGWLKLSNQPMIDLQERIETQFSPQ